MKKQILFFIGIPALAIAAWYLFYKEPVFTAKEGYLTNINEQGISIQGYDPVAYFVNSQPVKGKKDYNFHFEGATYWFASNEHLNLFKDNPKKYLPQYGAFCGYAVSIGKLRPVDPLIFQIEKGRLILQHTKEAFELFNMDLKGNILRANKNWPLLVENHVGKPVRFDKPASKPVAAK